MAVLTPVMRTDLERVVQRGRAAAEASAASAVTRLGVGTDRVPAYLSPRERALRRALRARARQLGDRLEHADGPGEDAYRMLVREVAYEQWHRLLFARFLEANGLLRHPDYGIPLTLAECEELAAELDEPDGWSVAARFAAEVLPGIFKPGDPCVQVPIAREDLLALERAVADVPAGTLTAQDALGWVYQFWQSRSKAEVNDSGRKVGGADLPPVTQLFTEHYMVRFLLENSLGAWWAERHPASRLVEEYDYLRRDADGGPAVRRFEDWPRRVAEVTVMDPCCGSGHFLVAAFGMLWRMRAEEEGLAPAAAQDAVLRENLFGLELDARCTQIAMFALALEAWKEGGYRPLPVPNVACSGIPAKAPLAEWIKLADGDGRIEAALGRLHALFADADTLGSLIDPVAGGHTGQLDEVDWHRLAPLLDRALHAEAGVSGDPASEVFGDAAAGIGRAADLLSRRYDLVATNVPYLGSGLQSELLTRYLGEYLPDASADLATAMVRRWQRSLRGSGIVAVVTPQNWLFLNSYRAFRAAQLRGHQFHLLGRLGPGAFSAVRGEVVKALLAVLQRGGEPLGRRMRMIDASGPSQPLDKAEALRTLPAWDVLQSEQYANEASVIAFGEGGAGDPLALRARSFQGLKTGDNARFVRKHWEIPSIGSGWTRIQSAPRRTALYDGCDCVLKWDSGTGKLARSPQARVQGQGAWGRKGVLISEMSATPCTVFTGEVFDSSAAAVIPRDETLLPALWHYMADDSYRTELRRIDPKLSVATASFTRVPFDVEHWRQVAARSGPLPEPASDDPTQWLFSGAPAEATAVLQVAVARLLGFRWPGQRPDPLDELTDAHGIVCLPPVAGAPAAADRVRELLAAAYGDQWSAPVVDKLLAQAGRPSGDLAGWLRDAFFKDHCKVFHNRPFIWHVWDGLKDGFSALVNYHRLDRATLERLTYTVLGWWIDRQRADADADLAGAGSRLAAAQELQRALVGILEGEPPLDIHVRWKPLSGQPMGWEPDLDDGVRLNIRPFVAAGVLRSKFTIHWKKDRGTEPDGSARDNDLHHTLAQKRAARETGGRTP
ncbi:DNA methyltransferase [Actinacidiphila sp. ITFR-21]|uniref:DNA methyltransferase n=1 Tax=Actinacidiphila sp. ITFR-21 TaxID=3075199 RepID=UPI00288AF15D|nr:DNA methyltransferase [Streptomyces sp. ITFR-21]WNI14281.1 hypothetical protein RLT57_01195 [Streptomyces sp. ITFR-21]